MKDTTMTNDDAACVTAGRHYLVYTDGACRPNPGPGGWGTVIQLKDGDIILRKRELSGCELPSSTNNRMELTAPLKALERLLEKDIPVVVYSDSNYVVKGMTTWISAWKTQNWRTAKGRGKPVENVDLWQALDAVAKPFPVVIWRWVKGHSGNPLNDRCDKIANIAIDTGLNRGKAA